MYNITTQHDYVNIITMYIETLGIISNFHLSKMLPQYVLYESPDGNYGSKQNGEWNGMMRELIIGVCIRINTIKMVITLL